MSPRALPGPSPHPSEPVERSLPPTLRERVASSLWSRDTPRLKVFLLVFVLSLALGLGLILLKTPVYQATATVEVRPSDDPAKADEPVEPQFLLAQVANITGRSMLEAVVERLGGDITTQEGIRELNRLEDAVKAKPVKRTALVKLTAVGEEPRLIALLLNTLIDVYGDALARKRLERGTGASEALGRQVQALEADISEKHLELDMFKERFDITSPERAENDMLTRLTALAADRDKALADEREAQAAYEQVRAAVGSEEAILLPKDEQALAAMGEQIAELEAGLQAKGKVYTKRYMALDPDAKEAREQLQLLRKRWVALRQSAQEESLIRARQLLDEALATLSRVEMELKQHKAAAKQFSSRFQQFQALNKQLARLEKTHRKVSGELTRTELNRAAEIARMEVMERAVTPTRPIQTENLRDAGIVAGVALLLGLFAVWLVEFLTRNKKQEAQAAAATATTVSVNLNDSMRLAAMPPAGPLLDAHTEHVRRIDSLAPAPRLEAPERILTREDLGSLWAASEGEARLLLALLLNGVGPQELGQLKGADLNLTQAELGVGERIVPLSPVLRRLLSELPPMTTEQMLLSGDAATPAGVDALLSCTAIDAGLSTPTEVDAERLQRSYLAWLVSQGVKLSELKRVAGALNASYLASFAPWSPRGPGYTLEEIEPFPVFLREPS